MVAKVACRVILLSFTATPLAAQAVVEYVTDFEPRHHAAVAYEPISGEGHLFGGTSTYNVWRNDTWRFDEGLWVRVTTATQPPALVAPAACTWPGHGMLVCGGGQTWLYDGSDWAPIATLHAPANVYALAFDPLRGVAVAYAPGVPTTVSAVWEFDGSDWLQRVALNAPPAVADAAMAWDPVGVACLLRTVTVGTGSPPTCYRWDGANWTTWAAVGAPGAPGFSLATAPNQSGVVMSGGATPPGAWLPSVLWHGGTSTSLELPNAPVPRSNSVAWLDEARGRTVVTATGTNFFASNLGSWYWDGAVWSQPPAGRRISHSYHRQPLVYDSWRGRVVTFGGMNAQQVHGELWQYDGRLVERLPGGPLPRIANGLAFDSWRGRVVLVGGAEFDFYGGHVWPLYDSLVHEWDGAMWHDLTVAGTLPVGGEPTGRMTPAMAFDEVRGKVVLFGGARVTIDGFLTWRNDTLEYDGATWTAIASPMTPPAAADPWLWFDPELGRCVLSVGSATWEWDGATWTQLALPPGNAVYDAARGVRVAGGSTITELQGNLWLQAAATPFPIASAFDVASGWLVGSDALGPLSYGDPAAATLRPIGRGCVGSGGLPVLHGELPPRLGRTITLHLAQSPTGAPWFGVFGADAPNWLGLSLPIDLTPLGMVGCELATAIDGYQVQAGTAWTFVVPSAPSLLGAALRMQAFVLDAAANPLGATTSNGVALRVGG